MRNDHVGSKLRLFNPEKPLLTSTMVSNKSSPTVKLAGVTEADLGEKALCDTTSNCPEDLRGRLLGEPQRFRQRLFVAVAELKCMNRMLCSV